MDVQSTSFELWPTRVTFYEGPVGWNVNRQLADEAIAASEIGGGRAVVSAAKRRVRGILEQSDAGQALKAHLFACARAVLGPWAAYLDPNHCENRALVMLAGQLYLHAQGQPRGRPHLRALPDWQWVGPAGEQRGYLRTHLGRLPKLDNAKSQRALGIDYGDPRAMIRDALEDMARWGHIDPPT